MAAVAEPPVIPEPLADPAVGQWVWVLFWRHHVLPDGRDAGAWNAIETRVVSAGRMVVVDLAGSAPPEESTSLGLFFAEPGDVYDTRKDALAASAGRKPPAPPTVPRI